MQITPAVLLALSNGFNAALNKGIEAVQPRYMDVTMQVNSQTALENYGWMKMLPGVRKWVGSRVINNLESVAYVIRNEKWEHTLGVKKDDIEDDRLGIYSLAFSQQGEIVAQHPDELVWATLLAGFATVGMDGQYFFDTDHVGYTQAGVETSWSNYQSGSGAPWFLMDLSRMFMRPLIFQRRTAVNFVQKTKPEDDNVFLDNEYLYGVDARYNAGFGFHQLALGSKATLDATNYAAARLALSTQRRPSGEAMNVRATHLVCGPSNETAARQLLAAEKLSNGGSNIWYQSAELMLVPTLG